MRKAFWISAAVLVALFAAALKLAHYIRPLGNPPQPYVRFCRIAVEGLNASSASVIQKTMKQLPGIRAINLNAEQGTVAIAFEDAKVSEKDFLHLLSASGFSGALIEAGPGECPVPHGWLHEYRSWFDFLH
ncbi:MAG: hypothetical protein NZL95_06710 [Chitinophagales bacterium]|nr:hypothetical protein [Chitinophagales bacterium]MDW8428229.1 hypothetical protein [Chitinophagales bacterium]